MTLPLFTTTTEPLATFSPCRRYRYTLQRTWDPSLPRVLWCMLNPSTADETQLDPTLRRCLGFARAWGYGSFEVVNLFAWRSTDPDGLRTAEDPVGSENDESILVAVGVSDLIVAGWGAHQIAMERAARVVRIIAELGGHDLHCVARTRSGQPGHPLYVPASAQPQLYRARGA